MSDIKYYVFGDSSDGSITSENATYSTARSGSSLTADDTGPYITPGQWWNGTVYRIYYGYFEFDVSGINATPTHITVYDKAQTGAADFYLYDWAEDFSPLTTAAWIAGGSIAAAKTQICAASRPGNEASPSRKYYALSPAPTKVGSSYFIACVPQNAVNNVAPTTTETNTIYMADWSGTIYDPLMLLVNSGATSETKTTSSSPSSWAVPSGVTELVIECWGAGGGGGVDANQEPGGNGGCYALARVAVTPSETLYYYVAPTASAGVSGTSSWVSRNSDGSAPLCKAYWGFTASSGNPGPAQSVTNNTGDIAFVGGVAAAAQGGGGSRTGSGGGSSAGYYSNGNDGTTGSGSATVGVGGAAVTGGGKGGDGGIKDLPAENGSDPGGGGGGKGSGTSTSGTGGRGQIILTYIPNQASLIFRGRTSGLPTPLIAM